MQNINAHQLQPATLNKWFDFTGDIESQLDKFIKTHPERCTQRGLTTGAVVGAAGGALAGIAIAAQTGAKAGAVAGTCVGPGHGTLIGAAVGAGVGAGIGIGAVYYINTKMIVGSEEYKAFRDNIQLEMSLERLDKLMQRSGAVDPHYECEVTRKFITFPMASPDDERTYDKDTLEKILVPDAKEANSVFSPRSGKLLDRSKLAPHWAAQVELCKVRMEWINHQLGVVGISDVTKAFLSCAKQTINGKRILAGKEGLHYYLQGISGENTDLDPHRASDMFNVIKELQTTPEYYHFGAGLRERCVSEDQLRTPPEQAAYLLKLEAQKKAAEKAA
jgi:hypothetical protein